MKNINNPITYVHTNIEAFISNYIKRCPNGDVKTVFRYIEDNEKSVKNKITNLLIEYRNTNNEIGDIYGLVHQIQGQINLKISIEIKHKITSNKSTN